MTRRSYLLKRVLYDLEAIDIRDPWEKVPQDSIGLPIYVALVFWYRLGLPSLGGGRRVLVYPMLQQVCTSRLNNHLPEMVTNTCHMMFKEIGIFCVLCYGKKVIWLVSFPPFLFGLFLPRLSQERRTLHTETMNIMASCSRDSSLHAVVSSGFPVATNSKPGGGFLSVVICFMMMSTAQ